MKRFLLWLIVLVVLFFAGRFAWNFYRGNSNTVETIPQTETVPVSALSTVQDLANKVGTKNLSWTNLIVEKKFEATKNPDALRDVAFAQSFTGDLAGAMKTLDDYCVVRETWEACKKTKFTFDIQSAKDGSGKSLTGTNFSVLGTSPDQGTVGTKIDLYKNTIVRTKVAKKGYSDFITRTQFVTWPNEVVNEKTVTIKPTLISSNKSIKVDASAAFSVKATNYTFTGEGNNFTYADGKPVTGEIEIFFWDLGSSTQGIQLSSLLGLDAFDSAGNSTGMISQGMQFVKAYSGETELKISKPIKAVGQMQNLQIHLDEFYAEKKLSAKAVLEKAPKNTSIDMKKAQEYFLPSLWRYDSSLGIWKSSEFNLLDNTGLIEFHIN